ncbi:MAG: hypothetical protein ACT6RN_08520 [Agrobacterium sp.]
MGDGTVSNDCSYRDGGHLSRIFPFKVGKHPFGSTRPENRG